MRLPAYCEKKLWMKFEAEHREQGLKRPASPRDLKVLRAKLNGYGKFLNHEADINEAWQAIIPK